MRRADAEKGLLGFCRKLSRDVLQLADPLRLSNGGQLPKPLAGFRRALKIEPLEARDYLNGTSIAAQVDPVWFQEVSGVVQSHAGAASWTAEGISSANSQSAASTNNAGDIYDWIVQFDTQSVSGITNIAQTAALLAGGGIQFQAICGLGIVGQVLIRSSGASLGTVEKWLVSDSDVAAFEEDAVRQIEATSNDPSLSQLWGMSKIDAYSAWNLTTGNTTNRVVVAEIDTGVDYTHRDLAANIWTNPNAGRDGFGNDLHGYDFANNDSDPMDDNGHGTHVAGTIGAVGNNGTGIVGVNWAVSIMPLKFMTSTGSGYLSDAIRAINYVTMERTQYGVNVRVINASWGGGAYSAAMQTAIQAAGNAGILFVVAAGNDAANNDVNPHYPSGYNSPNIVAVAATDQNDRLASFSCYGATSVDLAAPGVSIYSTLPGNKYGRLSGTSMATPHVAGAAALAFALDPTATVAEVRNALLQGVDRLSSLTGKVASGGRLDVLRSLQLVQSGVSNGTQMSSFTLSPSTVVQGTNVSFIARGLSAGIRDVYFYCDSDNDGVLENTDLPIGAASNVNGTATLTVRTDGIPAGAYRYFARAVTTSYQFADPVAQTLTITAKPSNNNNGGNNSTTPGATAINAGATVAGKLDSSAKEGWYSFQAVAGTKYTINTQLVTLRDSVLSLYDRDGKTLLATNDDYGSGLASRIDWTAPKTGTYFFKVSAFDKTLTGQFRVSLTAKTGTLSMSAVDGTSVSTANGDPASYGPNASQTRMIGDWSAPAVGSRSSFAADANLGGTTILSGRCEIGGVAAGTSICATSMFNGTLTLTRTTVAESAVERIVGDSLSLLDQHPELRLALGSILFDGELSQTGSAQSIDRDLEAVDTLFSQMAKDDQAGE
jgi:subtilisin family serine protease